MGVRKNWVLGISVGTNRGAGRVVVSLMVLPLVVIAQGSEIIKL